MPFIGVWSNLFPKSDQKPEKYKDFITVTIKNKIGSFLCVEAIDRDGNKYDVLNAYYYPFSFWELFFKPKKNIHVDPIYKFKEGKSYLSEVELYDEPKSNGSIGKIEIIHISSFGTKTYL